MGKGFSQNKLAQELTKAGLKATRVWVAAIETDRIRLHHSDLATISKVLHKPVEFFAADVPAPPAATVKEEPAAPYLGGMRVVRVPVVGVVGADTFAFNFDDPPLEPVTVLVEGSASKRYGAFRVRGDCMEPRFHDGEIVVVAEAASVPDGVPGVFRLDAHCTLKIPRRHSDGIELCPLNPKFQSKMYRTNKLVVVGVVVSVTRKP